MYSLYCTSGHYFRVYSYLIKWYSYIPLTNGVLFANRILCKMGCCFTLAASCLLTSVSVMPSDYTEVTLNDQPVQWRIIYQHNL